MSQKCEVCSGTIPNYRVRTYGEDVKTCSKKCSNRRSHMASINRRLLSCP